MTEVTYTGTLARVWLPSRNSMSLPFRSLATLVLAVAVTTCADGARTGVSSPSQPGRRGVAKVGFNPVFSKSAQAAAANMDDFGITFDHVRVVLVRPVNDTVIDTLVTFKPGQPDLPLDLTVPSHGDGESFAASIDYTNPSGVVFHGEGTVQSHAPDQPAPPEQKITVNYTGPGANIDHIVVAPKTVTVIAPGVQTFTVTAFDDKNAPIASPQINWSVSDASLASISNTGLLTPTGKRGTVTVTALAITKATDNASATISLPPAAIILVSGGGQTGKVGATLANPGIVRVTAVDGVGIAGVPVNFAAPTGGKVGAASVTTDASGAASSSLTLGGTAGPQSFAAVAQGFSVAIPATATAGDPATITVVSGNAQTDTVVHVVKNPFIVKVTDSFGNALSGAVVNWARTTGSGTVTASTSVTASDGTATMSYTLGTTTGTETVTASVAGVATPATFTVTSVAGKASGLTVVSGDGQSAAILSALAPFVVKVVDANGNPVDKAAVTWTATNGTFPSLTTTTDATGLSQNVMTLGTAVGTASATASAGTRTVAFGATVKAGIVSKTAIITGPPPSASAGVAISPSIQVALQDAGGNLTAATNAVTISLATNPAGGTLTGTLTRNAVAGVATFDDLKINKAGAGYSFTVTSAGTSGATSATFAIVAGAPSGLTIVAGDAQSATVNTAVATAPSVRLADGSGNPIAGATVTFTPSGGGTIAPSTPVVTDATGTATLTSWTLATVAGPQGLTATTPGVSSVTFTATATPGVPTHLSVVATPTTQVAGATATVTAQLLDAFNNPVPTAGRTINWTSTGGGSFASSSNTTTATGGTPPMNFTTTTISGVTHVITATDAGSLTVTGTASVATIPGPAAMLAVTTPPSSTVQAGVVFPIQPVVQLEDVNGNFVSQSGVSISATIGSGGGTLGGTTPVFTDATGKAAFAGLKIDGLVGPRTLAFSSTGLAGAPSGTITVNPGLPAALLFSVNPTSTTAGSTITPAVVVKIRDVDNNDVTTATNTIALAITAGTGAAGATLNGTTSLAASSGAATFSTLNITSASASAYTLRATATGLTTATSTGFLISAGPAASITIVTGNNQYFPSNSQTPQTSMQVLVKDAFANPVPGATVTFTAGAGATVGSGASTFDVSTTSAGTATTSAILTTTPLTVAVTAKTGALSPVTFTLHRLNQGSWNTQCKIGSRGTYCWGEGSYGSIGNGETAAATTPQIVSTSQTFTKLLESYGSHECGLTAAGAAYCWGRNSFGELGDNTTTDRSAPVAVAGGHAFVQLAGASYSTCGLTAGGQIYCWGWAGRGLYGDGDNGTIRTVPTLVTTAGKLYTQIVVLDDYACGIEVGGTTSCWGAAPDGLHVTPAPVPSAPAFVSLTAGFYHICGLTAAGNAFCWSANNGVGQIGDGTTTPRSSPVPIASANTFGTIHAYAYNTCAVTLARAMYCWGDQLFGSKIGDGSSGANVLTPTAVSGGISFSSIMGGGISFTCGNDTFGNAYCWGTGGLGNSDIFSSTTPVLVDWPEGFVGVGGVRRPRP